jgi:prepilin signal peptidase PulO-like enzyme (type II secretory pathway)
LVIFFLLGGALGALAASWIQRGLDRHEAIKRVGLWRAMRQPAHCDACRRPLSPGDQIPIVAWLRLDGKARCCGARLRLRLLAVEVLGFALGATGMLGLLLLI